MSNPEDSESSPSHDNSDPSTPAEKPSKTLCVIDGEVCQTMAVTSILKTTTRCNDETKIEMQDIESETGSINDENTTIQCTTIIETTTVYTTAIDTKAIDTSNATTTSMSNGCYTTTPVVVDTVSCNCCTLVGSSEVCSKNENLQSDRLEFCIFLFLHHILNEFFSHFSQFNVHASSIKKLFMSNYLDQLSFLQKLMNVFRFELLRY